ncbi:hypothetical protein RJT34_12947 [Clitoria ternatea]|uniref:EF-hand domain-containing protein n=1 Tax=Clitoria ternatea TaxID=43366 RepID=A0AAN9JQB8_CLITE
MLIWQSIKTMLLGAGVGTGSLFIKHFVDLKNQVVHDITQGLMEKLAVEAFEVVMVKTVARIVKGDPGKVIAERLSEEEIGGLKELFKMIDTDNSGTITFEELKEGLRSVGSNLMESEIKSLMEAVDYAEFAAMMKKSDDGVGRSRTMKGNLNFNIADAFGVNESS